MNRRATLAAVSRRRRRSVDDRPLFLTLAAVGLVALLVTFVLEWQESHATCRVSGRLMLGTEPLVGAEVGVNAWRESARTDATGVFRLPKVPVGCVTLTVTAPTVTAGFPIKVPRWAEWDLGDLPVYRLGEDLVPPDESPPAGSRAVYRVR